MAVIVFGIGSSPSHLMAVTQLAHNLAQRGHEIVFLSSDPWTGEHAARHGFRFHRLPAPPLAPPGRLARVLPIVGHIQNSRRALRAAERMLCQDGFVQAVFEQLHPDLLVLENSLGVYALAALPLGKPVVLVGAHTSSYKRRGVPPLDAGFLPRDTRLGRLRCEFAWRRHRFFRRLDNLVLGDKESIMDRIARRNGLDPEIFIDRQRYLFPAPRLPEFILCPQEFDFPGDPVPCTWCGPSILERPPADFDWSWRREAAPLIYCALGSIAPRLMRAHSGAFLAKVIAAFRDDPSCDVLIDTEDRHPDLPSHIRTIARVPQLEALRRASLFINHAGTGSIKEAIWYAVPMLLSPFFGDQPGNAARVEYHGLGERIPRRRVTPERIRAVAYRLLNDERYHRNLRRFQALFVQAEQQSNAADHIERILVEFLQACARKSCA